MTQQHPLDRSIDAEGLRIHYLEWGSDRNPPLVLLHGIARGAHAFDHVAPHFADRYRVIAIDMRGHGESDWHPAGAYLVEDYTKDVAALIRELGLKDIVLWGNSTGGRVAQVIAGAAPELVAAVIVEDVGPERPSDVSSRRGQRMAVEEKGWSSAEELLEHVTRAFPRTATSVLEHLVRHGSRTRSDGRIVWNRDPAILQGFVPTEIWESVQKIRAPIVYILGGLSAIVPPETQTRLKAMLPQARIVTMPGLGHFPSDEQPEAFVALVDEFLAQAAKRRG